MSLLLWVRIALDKWNVRAAPDGRKRYKLTNGDIDLCVYEYSDGVNYVLYSHGGERIELDRWCESVALAKHRLVEYAKERGYLDD